VIAARFSEDGVCGIADAILLDQIPCHSGEHIVIIVNVLQSLSGKLSLHRESHCH
jgi:hypothetical protein